MKIRKGSAVATNRDTSSMLRNANIDVVREVSGLRNDVSRLIDQMARSSRQEAAIIGLR